MKTSKKFVFACFVFAIVGLLALFGQRVFASGMDGCEKQCSTCQTSCEKASAYLKGKGDTTASASAQKTLADCADICSTSHNFMQRDSKFHPALCKVCADVCSSCAKACEELKDPKLKECIEECKKCATSCKKMAS